MSVASRHVVKHEDSAGIDVLSASFTRVQPCKLAGRYSRLPSVRVEYVLVTCTTAMSSSDQMRSAMPAAIAAESRCALCWRTKLYQTAVERHHVNVVLEFRLQREILTARSRPSGT
jgi:hypothetical protein